MMRSSRFLVALVSTFLTAISSIQNAQACPAISGIPDYNCDGALSIVVMGDSVVYGTGDQLNKGRGGYVARLAKALPDADVSNLGDPGAHTLDLLQLLDDTFSHDKNPQVKSDLVKADIVILDIGRNDRWEFGTPNRTYRNLKRAANIILNEVTAIKGYPPTVVTAVLYLPNRGAQGPWVKDLNKLILKGSSNSNPSDLRFDLVSKRLLNKDGIHPTSAGYKAAAAVLLSYLKKTLAPRMKKNRKDSDDDGIPDIIESNMYLTNPLLPDTDGDGKSDGEEVFTLKTNPLLVD